MIRQHMLLTLFFFLSTFLSSKGQDDRVYEIPFSVEKKLLVFKGKLNGVETD
ncbi:MAG: hypothetical protein H7174_11015, partial [Flavobacterium sp.]|nr:hypothetical protein [Flavobacterium sp.]